MIAHTYHTKNAVVATRTNAKNAVPYTFSNRSLRSSFPEVYSSTTRAAKPNFSRRLSHWVSVTTWVGDRPGDAKSRGHALPRQAYRNCWPVQFEKCIGRIAILR